MCGISGIISLDGSKITNLEKRIRLMMQLLYHRGPDQEGFYVSPKGNLGLSNNRLSIVAPKNKIDLPFTKNKNEFLSFNGEIYNYLFLKDELKKKGVNFQTSTDTEVLYEFLKYYQYKNFEKLNGMWSFAFFNQNKNELILSRDLLGERHLFYMIDHNELIFSSEIEPILHASLNSNELDFESIVTSWKFNSCSPGKTLIKNIYKLKPGTNLHLSNGKIRINQFQKLHPEKWFEYFNKSPSINEVNKKFEEIFRYETDLRLPKDINYLTSLSGGIDSSTLVFFISKLKDKTKTIFGISDNSQEKKEQGYSELETSYYVAKKLNSDHNHIYLNTQECLDDLNFFASNGFDGCIDPAVTNFSGLSSYAKKNNFKVMLFSDGVDELLGGYEADIEANKIDRIVKLIKSQKLIKFLLKFDLIKKSLTNILKLKKNKDMEFSYDPIYFRVNHSVCPNKFLKTIINDYDINKQFDYGKIDSIYKELVPKMDYSQLRALNYVSKSIPDMFSLRLDKSSMRHSIEVRLPFLSIRLVEFFIAMPGKYRFRNGKGKYFLRKFVESFVDNIISKRPKKGMGNYLWATQEVRKNINFEKKNTKH